MPKTKISEYSATANSNTDVASINIDEGCAPSGINNAIRAVMGHLKDFQSGTSNDPFTVGSSGSLTLSYGTANGVAYLNGSKVLTTGSSLTWDGTNLTVNTGTVSATYGKLTVAGGISITPDSSSKFQIGRYSAGAPYSYIKMGSTSSGLKFTDPADAVDLAVLDSSGNFGLGVTPSAQLASYKSFQFGIGGNLIGRSDNAGIELSSNAYRNTSGNYIYLNTDNAASYRQYNGQHQWYYAASGTAGNAITFTQAMTLDADGDLGIGQTSPAFKLDVQVAVGGAIAVRPSTSTGNAKQSALRLYGSESVTTSRYAEVACFNDTAGSDTNALTFSTGYGTSIYERGRFSSDGNLLVGTTGLGTIGSSSGFQITSSGAIYSASTGDSVFSRRSTNGTVITFRRDTTSVGSIDVTTTATSYVTSSDYRLKNTIAPMTGALAKVAALKPVTYKWNVDGSDGEGFIAHELAEVCPQAVTGEKDAVDADGNPKYQGIDTSFLVATLTAAIQEQNQLITQLTARITALESA